MLRFFLLKRRNLSISDQCKQDIAKYNEESQGMKPKKKDEK